MTLDIFDAVASRIEERYEEHRLEWHDDPAGFARDCFKWPRGKELRAYQADILTELAQEHRVAVRSLHGAGKSATAAFSVNWFAATREAAGINWKVVTTAGAWRQLEHYLWPEIRLWANRLRFDRLGRAPYDMSTELLKLSLQLPHGQAFAVASSDATLIEGAHADEVLFVFDESKRLDVATPIPTPTGWTTMGEIEVGDQVLDEMGRPTLVTRASPILENQPCSKVIFSDGSELVADDGHLWATLPYSRRQALGNLHAYQPKHKLRHAATSDWREHWDSAQVVETRHLQRETAARTAIPTCRPLELPAVDLPIDPYVLGAWLGDGTSRCAAITTMDAEVLERIATAGHPVTWSSTKKANNKAQTYGIGDLRWRLRENGLLQNKHIPAVYLRASKDQRLELLRGLMDTDGCVQGGARVSFSNTNEALARGVAELVRSFGWKTRFWKGTARLNGVDMGPVYLLRWSADECCFHLSRKKDKWHPRRAQASSSTIRTVVSVERVPSVPTRCIAVDSPRHLYLAGESFIPTHNSIHPDIFDAAEGALSSGEGYALSLSTPGPPIGRFYDIHARKPGFEDWKTRHVTLAQAIETGQVTTQWAEQRKRQFGEHSAAYQNRVLGEFASSDEDSVIPLSWVEAAIERWKIRLTELGWEERNGLVVIPDLGPMSDLGIDVASTGDDKTVMGPKHGDVIGPLRYFSLASTMETTGYAAGILRAHEGSRAIVDVSGGLGLGVHDRLREQGLRSVAYIGQAEPTRHRDRSRELEFVNLRADAWWNLREMLDPIYFPTLCLPPDDMMIGDLCTPRRKEMQSSGKIQVESKIDIKKRLKRSPDAGDAVVQACMPRPNFRRRARMTYGGTLVR